ncbi:MAG TPA: hypothetical protein VM074_11245 [Solimonas sp.]|nr:hypothetical protein [Solimonas sp.]
MIANAIQLIFTAVATSALTWAMAWWWYRTRLEAQLDARLALVQQEFEQRVKSAALAAGQELLPQLREQVRLGFADALKASDTAALVEDAAGVMKAGTDIVTGGLGALFGLKPRR